MKKSEIKSLLPMVVQKAMHDESILSTIVEIMERMHAPAESLMEQLDVFFDPRRTKEVFLPMLAQWLGLGYLFELDGNGSASPPRLPMDSRCLRELIAAAARLAQWRGTLHCMQQMLEAASGTTGFSMEEGVAGSGEHAELMPFHVRVTIPRAAEDRRALIERIVAHEKPAHVTAEVVLAQ